MKYRAKENSIRFEVITNSISVLSIFAMGYIFILLAHAVR